MLQETLCGKGGYLAPLTQTQMAPVIWGVIIGLVALFLTKVHLAYHRVHCRTGLALLPCANSNAAVRVHCWSPGRMCLAAGGQSLGGAQVMFGAQLLPPPPAMQAAAVAVVALAAGGLYLLWRVTTTDPGFLPCGRGAGSGKGKSPPRNSNSGRGSSKGDSQYRCLPTGRSRLAKCCDRASCLA